MLKLQSLFSFHLQNHRKETTADCGKQNPKASFSGLAILYRGEKSNQLHYVSLAKNCKQKLK